MRFLSAPWIKLLEDQLWVSSARQARTLAHTLAAGLQSKGVQLYHPPQVNSVFAKLDALQKQKIEHAGFHVYDFQEKTTRFMTSWKTQKNHIDKLISILP